MTNFKIGGLYDAAFGTMQPKDIKDNLEAVAWGVEERSYTKNLTPDEIVEKKDQFAQNALVVSEIQDQKKEAIERFKAMEKLPKEEQKELLSAIKFKSEQKHGKLFLIDDQQSGMMYSFDENGVCVDARPLTKAEKQTKLKIATNE
jgi:DNA integrity scanning protein DisA with diadenylate cyclase activity